MSTIVNGIKNLAVGSAGKDGPLFEAVKVGKFDLQARLVYAPLTRCRGLDNIAQPAAATYYSQRARPGILMLTEGTCVSQQGQGYPCVPGIHSEKQTESWKPVVKAVHDKGGIFFMQLWHVGRSSHNDYQPDGGAPVGPSAVAIKNGQVYAPKLGKMVDFPVPRALEKSELPGVIGQYVQGAKNALKAGFDGVELHCANGYLLDEFLKQSSNHRSDEYGGSIENRCRLVLEAVEAVIKEVGPGRVGIRLSPYSWEFNDCYEPDVESTIALNVHLLEQLNKLPLAYVHIVTARAAGSDDANNPDLQKQNLVQFRKAYKGTIIAAGGFKKDTAEEELQAGHADLICFGRWWLATPDFPERLKENKPLNKYHRDTFYTQDQVVGYTDYPFLKDIPSDTPTEKHYSGVTVFAPQKEQKTATGNEP